MSTDAPQQTEAETANSYGFCGWHQRFARGVRLIRIVEQGSGRGGGVHFACPPCIEMHDLQPYTDQP